MIFKSLKLKIINITKTTPNPSQCNLTIKFRYIITYINPTEPDLRSNPAKIIEPTVDASTWATGSQ